MRWLLYTIAILLMLSGGLFLLQGLSFVPSRVMYGRQEWVLIGGAMAVAGVALAVFTYRRAVRSTQPPNHPTT